MLKYNYYTIEGWTISMSTIKNYNNLKEGDDILFFVNTLDSGQILFDGTIIGEPEENQAWVYYLDGFHGEISCVPFSNILFVADEEGENISPLVG